MPLRLLTSGYGGDVDILTFDPAAGTLAKSHTAKLDAAPTWSTLSPTRPLVYTGAEFAEPDGLVHALSYDAQAGTLTPLGGTAKVGAGPVHFALSHDGRHLYTANYSGGSLSTVELDGEGMFVEGSEETQKFKGVGPNKERQEAPHVHGVCVLSLSFLRRRLSSKAQTDAVERTDTSTRRASTSSQPTSAPT